jgi:predicted ATP-grasp superfamily ATP-dependent carboligase
MEMSGNTLLLVGVDNSSLAQSVKKAGKKAFTVDYFGDVDVMRISDGFISVIEQKPCVSSGKFEKKYSPEALFTIVKSLYNHGYKFEGILLSSGLDDSFTILDKINDMFQIIGNSPETIKAIRDKKNFFQELEKMKIFHPKTLFITSLDSAIKEAKDIGYPLILKPSKGFSGVGVRRVDNKEQLMKEYRNLCLGSNEQVVIQEYIKGTPASISFIASYSKCKIIAINEQLIGLKNTCQPEPFGYCGNITPYLVTKDTMEKCNKIGEKITNCFNLIGSNGVDLVISEDDTPYVIEVNPRFQGSLMCVERAYGINLVKLHLAACNGKEIEKKQQHSSLFSTRLIIFAPKRLVAPDLVSKPLIMDVPCPGSIIEKGEPICSIISDGKTKNESLYRAQETAKTIFNLV